MLPLLIELFVKTLATIIGNKVVEHLAVASLCEADKRCLDGTDKITELKTRAETIRDSK